MAQRVPSLGNRASMRSDSGVTPAKVGPPSRSWEAISLTSDCRPTFCRNVFCHYALQTRAELGPHHVRARSPDTSVSLNGTFWHPIPEPGRHHGLCAQVNPRSKNSTHPARQTWHQLGPGVGRRVVEPDGGIAELFATAQLIAVPSR